MRMTNPPILTAVLLAAAILTYGAVIEPGRLTVNTIVIREGRLAQVLAGRKVALLSDLHFKAEGEPIAEATLRRLTDIRPDLVLLAGDYVDWGSRAPAYEHALAFLARLQAPLGVFAVLGDSDGTFSRKSCDFCHLSGSTARTNRHSVVFLKDSQEQISTPLGEFLVAGTDPANRSPARSRALRLLGGDVPALLLSHTPEVFNGISSSREVIVLAGSTHGGQVWLPKWLWRLTGGMPDPDHVSGFFREDKKALVVTRGLGTSRIRFRFGASPEIVVLEFR